jgi:cytochrome b561
MRWHLGRTLFWTTIGLVAGSFVLALVGEEIPSTRVREQILNWHEWLGLLSLLTLIATLITQWFDKHPGSLPLPHWLPWLRGAVGVFLYILLLLQPLSGWLLASHEGKLASFFGWMLPPLASPSGTLAHYGYVYHGLGGGLILLIAALNLRINLTAYVFSLVASVRRRARRTTPEAQKRTYRDGA